MSTTPEAKQERRDWVIAECLRLAKKLRASRKPSYTTLHEAGDLLEQVAEFDLRSTQPPAGEPAVAEALRELVELKDLKDRLEFIDIHRSTDNYREYGRLKAEYERRKPLAWAAARAALGVDRG